MTTFTLGKKIAGNIYEVEHHPTIIAKKYKKRKSMIGEKSRLLSIKHIPNVSRIISSHGNYIFMERIQGSDLFSIIYNNDPLPEYKVLFIAYKLLNIVKNLHDIDIIHGDIKPENIMFDPNTWNITLIDFEKDKSTNRYRSPESYFIQDKTDAEDIWCIGSTLYTLIMGHNPYNNFDHLCSKYSHHPINRTDISDNVKDFIVYCMDKNYYTRPTVSDCLNHPWLQSFKRPIYQSLQIDNIDKSNDKITNCGCCIIC